MFLTQLTTVKYGQFALGRMCPLQAPNIPTSFAEIRSQSEVPGFLSTSTRERQIRFGR
jgi:hypothetical protein